MKNEFLSTYVANNLRACQLKQLSILEEMDRICQKVPDMRAFYLARDMKKIRSWEQDKTMFTRITGAIFSAGRG